MKKLFAIALALALTISLAACGGNTTGDNNSTESKAGNNTTSSASANNNGNNGAAKTPSITPAAGWEKDTTAGTGLTYKCTDTSKASYATFNVKSEPTRSDKGLNTPRDYAQYAINELKSSGYTFSDITETTVNGMSAAEFTGTTSGMKQKSVFVMTDVSLYSLVCTTMESNYDKVSADFQSMIDSFTLK